MAAVYSKWTNSSFKAPLITSAFACLAGNVLYCAGYDMKSIWVLTASRLVLGFGEFCLHQETHTALHRLALHFANPKPTTRLTRVDQTLEFRNIMEYHMIAPRYGAYPLLQDGSLAADRACAELAAGPVLCPTFCGIVWQYAALCMMVLLSPGLQALPGPSTDATLLTSHLNLNAQRPAQVGALRLDSHGLH